MARRANGEQERSTWPMPILLGGVVFGVLTASTCTMTLCGREVNQAKLIAGFAGAGAILLRVLIARIRREQGRAWIVYAWMLYGLAPIIMVLEAVLRLC